MSPPTEIVRNYTQHALTFIFLSMCRHNYNNFFDMVYGIPTVDGRNPAPPEMYKTLKIMGYLPDQLVQDFFHQQYFMDQNHPAETG